MSDTENKNLQWAMDWYEGLEKKCSGPFDYPSDLVIAFINLGREVKRLRAKIDASEKAFREYQGEK